VNTSLFAKSRRKLHAVVMLGSVHESPETRPLPPIGAPAASVQPNDHYKRFEERRAAFTQAVLNSKATKKIVVAGPGTGKTTLFKEVLKGKTKALTLSFINLLIEDLATELCGLSEVRTLHSFAAGELNENIFPKLSKVISEDAEILVGKAVLFDPIFYEMLEEKALLAFYKTRKDYYRHYGFADIIYKLVDVYKREPGKIPRYEQVVVDEFQDFNKLEVALIDQLASKSPVLIAGDDDQALYDRKKASPEFIRSRHQDQEYARFPLPYCSRSTRVIVDAVNDIVESAIKAGYLGARITKHFEYFECAGKNEESRDNPKIVYTQAFGTMVPHFIQSQIEQGARSIRKKFSVLVICPIPRLSHDLVTRLRAKGFRNVQGPSANDEDVTLLEGLNLLLKDADCNLGWRIAAKCLLEADDFQKCLDRSAEKQSGEKPERMCDLVPANERKKIRRMLTVLRAVRDDKSLQEQKHSESEGEQKVEEAEQDISATQTHEFRELLEALQMNPCEVIGAQLKGQLAAPRSKWSVDASIRKTPIQVSSVHGSKGLAADYVFIVGFDDQYLIGSKDISKISDQSICKLLVAITRARKKAFLISTVPSEPHFLSWIKKERWERIDAVKKKPGS